MAFPQYVELSANSSVISGLTAFIFDILLLALIKAQAQALSSVATVRLVYDSRHPVVPTTSRISILAGGPVGPSRLVRLLSFLIAVTTTCTILLSFSINGVTVPRYEDALYRSLVSISGVPPNINFDREFIASPPGEDPGPTPTSPKIMVSRRLKAFSNPFACGVGNSSHIKINALAYKDLILDETPVPLFEAFPDGDCVTTKLFKEDLVGSEYGRFDAFPQRCTLDDIAPPDGGGNSSWTARVATSECQVTISSVECFKASPYTQTSCAGVATGTGNRDGRMYLILVADAGQLSEKRIVHFDTLRDRTNIGKFASNVAFFSSLSFPGDVASYINMALSEIKYDVVLQRKVIGEYFQVTKIDLRLAIPVVSIIGVNTFVLCVALIWLWVVSVVYKGRGKYNSFCSVGDVLALGGAAPVSKLRRRRVQRMVGVQRDDPIIGVMNEGRDKCGDWLEEEIL